MAARPEPTGFALNPVSGGLKATWGVTTEAGLEGFNLLVWGTAAATVGPTTREYTFTGLQPNHTYVVSDTALSLPWWSAGLQIAQATTGASQWKPMKALTWYWQLQGTVNNSEPVMAYDIDGFENEASEVSTLHAKGIKAICYMDVGTWEEWRPDASSFPAAVKGKNNGWPGEKYLDIRALSTLEPIMTKRFETCRSKGFDAVEPDNMDTFEASTGFPLTGAQQITYDTWIAGEVHSLGMAVLQKNDGEQTSALKAHFDGALTEECNVYSECSNFTPYLAEGKPVLNAEYGSSDAFCSADNAAGIEGARLDLELDGKVFQPCW